MKLNAKRSHSSADTVPTSGNSDDRASQLEDLTEGQLAKLLQVSRRKLESDRHLGSGVPHVKYGRRVLYRRVDVEAYLQSRTFESTADARRADLLENLEIAGTIAHRRSRTQRS